MPHQTKHQPAVLNVLENHGKFVEVLSENKVDEAKQLIDEMLHADMRDEYDRTPLMYAIIKESQDIIQYLFHKKANPCLRDIEGYTALHRAAQIGSAKQTQEILEYAKLLGFDINDLLEIRSCRGLTALCSAATLGYVDVVDILLKYGANPEVRTYDGHSILMTLAIKGHAPVIKLLLSKTSDSKEPIINVNEINSRGWTALHFAAYHNQKDAALALLEFGADINKSDDIGMTPLMITTKCDMAIFLLSQGAYINKTTKDGESALTRALRHHQEKLLTLLISQHANLLDEKVQAVCAQELPVSLHDLYIQERDEQKVAFQLLIMGHADEIKLAYDTAKIQDNLYLINAISCWFEEKKKILCQACLSQDVYVIDELLKKGISPLECRVFGINLVAYTALTRRFVSLELLLSYIDQKKLNKFSKFALIISGYNKLIKRVKHDNKKQLKHKQYIQSVLSIEDEDKSVKDIRDAFEEDSKIVSSDL